MSKSPAMLLLRNGWADCHQIWCVVGAHVAMHIPQVLGGVHLLVRTCGCYSVLRMSGTAGRIALKFWCAVRDKLAMRFKLLRGRIHLHVRTSASRFRISGTAERIAPKFGMLLLRSQLAR